MPVPAGEEPDHMEAEEGRVPARCCTPMAPNISGSRTVLTGEGYGDLFNAQSVPRSLERLSTTRILAARKIQNGVSEFV